MKIEKDGSRIEFVDNCNYSCAIDVSVRNLRFSFSWECDGSAYFSQEQVKQLLPYLQSFAETGTLEPATESTLQGGSLLDESIKKTASLVRENKRLEAELETMQEAGVAMAASIVDQGKRIEAFQELVRGWQNTHGCACPHCYPDLHKKTAQLLGEEQANDPTS